MPFDQNIVEPVPERWQAAQALLRACEVIKQQGWTTGGTYEGDGGPVCALSALTISLNYAFVPYGTNGCFDPPYAELSEHLAVKILAEVVDHGILETVYLSSFDRVDPVQIIYLWNDSLHKDEGESQVREMLTRASARCLDDSLTELRRVGVV